MKKLFYICILSLVTTSVFSQGMILHDPVTGRVFKADKYSAIRGTPFLFDKWLPGSASSERGTYHNMQLKLDAYDNVVYFNKNDEPYEFQEKIVSFTLVDPDTMYYRKGITGPGLKPEQFVRVLVEGKLGAYKSDIKMVSEMSEINSGMVKTFTGSTRYYISKDGKIELVKLNKSDIFEFIKDKEDKVKEYIDQQKISTKKEADFVNILKYYNSL
jgi:hypothetical protein